MSKKSKPAAERFVSLREEVASDLSDKSKVHTDALLELFRQSEMALTITWEESAQYGEMTDLLLRLEQSVNEVVRGIVTTNEKGV